MDTGQKRDAFDVKSHKEILQLFKELDAVEQRVKNLQAIEDVPGNAEVVPQATEIIEPLETIQELQPERPIDTTQPRTPKKRDHPSLLDLYKKQQVHNKKSKPGFFSYTRDQTPYPEPLLIPKGPRQKRKQKPNAKPLNSTFKLYITEEGTLAGLDIKKPKPQRTQSSEPETKEPGFKGTLKHLVKKIIPRASKRGDKGMGIGGRIKGIVKRKPKE